MKKAWLPNSTWTQTARTQSIRRFHYPLEPAMLQGKAPWTTEHWLGLSTRQCKAGAWWILLKSFVVAANAIILVMTQFFWYICKIKSDLCSLQGKDMACRAQISWARCLFDHCTENIWCKQGVSATWLVLIGWLSIWVQKFVSFASKARLLKIHQTIGKTVGAQAPHTIQLVCHGMYSQVWTKNMMLSLVPHSLEILQSKIHQTGVVWVAGSCFASNSMTQPRWILMEWPESVPQEPLIWDLDIERSVKQFNSLRSETLII